jgi:hypothetical protein
VLREWTDTMPRFTSFNTSALSQEEVAGILADYLALERTRIVKRLLLVRCGALTLVALAVAFVARGLSVYARWLPVVLCVTPPIWAWLAELQRTLRLSHRLAGVEDKKVIKSS